MTEQRWLFAKVSLPQYLNQVQKNKVTDQHIYSVNGVLFGYEGAINRAKLDILDEEYYRNFLILSDVKDGKATLMLEPNSTYYFMSWKNVYNEETEEFSIDYNTEEFTTGTTGKKTLQVPDIENAQYKVAKAETYYTLSPEDVLDNG